MTKDNATAAYALLSYYAKLYKDRYGVSPTINKYKEKWAASSILEDYGKETSHKVLEYYFKMQKEGHPLNWFYNNFDVLLDRINESEKDQQLRKERRAQTALLRQEWLNGNA